MRREVVVTTLRHLEKEQHEVDENNDWLDYAAYESRVALLGDLTDGYLKERLEIDSAMTRIIEKNYALCVCFICKEMFDRLNEWYTQKNDAIDKALDRVKQSKYGLCLAVTTPLKGSG